jgi:hypothetical protein
MMLILLPPLLLCRVKLILHNHVRPITGMNRYTGTSEPGRREIGRVTEAHH